MAYELSQISILRSRLLEKPHRVITVTGPRQVGKTRMVRDALTGHPSNTYVTADPEGPDIGYPVNTEDTSASRAIHGSPRTTKWLIQQWNVARAIAKELPSGNHVLAIDEVQKIPRWSEVVKGLWDDDNYGGTPLHVILLGSSPWLMNKGLAESLAGRYEPIHLTHWAYREMQEAFDFSLEEYIYFGGYPGPGRAEIINDETRWRSYINNSLIKPNIEKDILNMTRVDKPALLKEVLELGCGAYSGQIIGLKKLAGQLQGAVRDVTVAHYLLLLSQAGLLTGLQQYAGQKHRQRASPPKLIANNTALISAQSGYTFQEAKNDRSFWGRLVESAIGAHLINSSSDNCNIFYWRDKSDEVDFILSKGNKLIALEVKSGKGFPQPKGLDAFTSKYKHANKLLIGEGGISLTELLSRPADDWLE